MESFTLKATLGTGSFGRVRLVQYESEYFAMKMLRKTRVVEMKQENHIKWEQKILSSIRHPFIVNLEATFQDKYFLYLVLELVSGGEFFTLLKRAGKLQLPHCAFYASQIVLVFQVRIFSPIYITPFSIETLFREHSENRFNPHCLPQKTVYF